MMLSEFFEENKKVAVAFSGGVDSAFLLYEAKLFGAEVCAYYMKTCFQPEFELRDAYRLAEELSVPMKVLEADILSVEGVAENPADRCYLCKRKIFTNIWQAAAADGFKVLLDGTNASDETADRPGMKALTELEVRSPLRECGLTKDEIRLLSREAGLFTWDKPAYACLATRIPVGRQITQELLERIEGAEAEMTELGFRDFRVRVFNDAARLQLPAEQFSKAVMNRKKILEQLRGYFDTVLLDLKER